MPTAATTGKPEIKLHAVVSPSGEQWVAMCLEYYIGAQGKTHDQAIDRLIATIEAELEESLRRHGKPFAGIGPAPPRFHELWNRRSTMTHQKATIKNAPNVDVDFGLAA